MPAHPIAADAALPSSPAPGRLPDLPRLVPLPSAQRIFGPSRATFYRAAAAGQVRMLKIGRATFLETETVLAWLARLPAIAPRDAT